VVLQGWGNCDCAHWEVIIQLREPFIWFPRDNPWRTTPGLIDKVKLSGGSHLSSSPTTFPSSLLNKKMRNDSLEMILLRSGPACWSGGRGLMESAIDSQLDMGFLPIISHHFFYYSLSLIASLLLWFSEWVFVNWMRVSCQIEQSIINVSILSGLDGTWELLHQGGR